MAVGALRLSSCVQKGLGLVICMLTAIDIACCMCLGILVVRVSVYAVVDDSPIRDETFPAAEGGLQHWDSHVCATCECLQLQRKWG